MKPIILTVTTGRSGTQLLHSLLMRVPGMNGDHEEERYPSFSTVRRGNIKDPSLGREYVQKFLNRVENLPGKYYSLTDLSSSNGAIEHYLDLGVVPNIIVLRRDPRKVSTSYFSLDVIPHRTKQGWEDWYPSPSEPGVLSFENYEKAHSYQYCYWYCCDTERRAQYYPPLIEASGGRIWETSIEQLIDTNHFNSMLDHFNLPNVDHVPTDRVDKWADWHIREVPPPEMLYNLELDVLNRIPTDFKQNLLARGWGRP